MNFEQTAILAIMGMVLVLFIWGKFRYDLVALLALFGAAICGLIPNDEVFSGFGHPATITVAIVLILSYGLTKSGAVEGITSLIEPIAKIPSLHIAALIFIAAFLSMFMNNVGALALLMPVAISSTLKAERVPATVLMPLSFGSILGGLVTLIGTPPNIIIASYRKEVTGEAFTMFDFAPVGGAVAFAGILFITFIGWRFVAVRKTSAGQDLFDIEGYIFKIKISKDSKFLNKQAGEVNKILKEYNVRLLSLMHKQQRYPLVPKEHKFLASDLILVEGSHEDIDRAVSDFKLKLIGADDIRKEVENSKNTKVLEAVVTPGSYLEGRLASNVKFKQSYDVNLLAISRSGKSYKSWLKDFRFQSGDVVLLHGDGEEVDDAITKLNCFPLAKRDLDFGKRKYAIPALLIFIAAILVAVTGLTTLQVALGGAVIIYALFNIVPIKEFYNGVDWPVIVLLGAMIPVGNALESTGSTKLLADLLLDLSGGASLVVVLTLILVITMTLSDILNNAATAILMAPIAKNIAETSGVSADPFLMAVAVGASCAFLTPIGHQNNALVLGPGGYRFGDYWKIGLPLEIIIVAVSIPMILLIWPF